MRRRSSVHSILPTPDFTTPSPRLVRGSLRTAFSRSPPPRSGNVPSPLATNGDGDASGGFFAVRFFFLVRGNASLLSRERLDADGKPTLHKDGIARFKQTYDARGNMVETAYFDTDGKPTLHKDRVARITQTYDTHDNLAEQAYFDTEGKPTFQKDGIARVTYKCDAHGNVVDTAYFERSRSGPGP